MNLPAEQLQSNKTLTLVLYILYIAAIFSAGLLAIIALVPAYWPLSRSLSIT